MNGGKNTLFNQQRGGGGKDHFRLFLKAYTPPQIQQIKPDILIACWNHPCQ